jgi:hypothetical protein
MSKCASARPAEITSASQFMSGEKVFCAKGNTAPSLHLGAYDAFEIAALRSCRSHIIMSRMQPRACVCEMRVCAHINTQQLPKGRSKIIITPRIL